MKTQNKRRRYSRRTGNISNGSSNGVEHVGFLNCNDLVLVHILSRLPVKSLMRFKCVSKRWRSIIQQDKCLIDLHQAHRCKDITSFLVCPTRFPPSKELRLPQRMNIRSVLFSKEDLRFGKRKRGSSAVVTLYNNLVLNVGCDILEPVHGLLCFVNYDEPGSVLIHNPCTGEKTPWIETSTSEALASSFGLEQVVKSCGRMKLFYRHAFGFGFDTATKQHKVICVYEASVRNAIWGGRTGFLGKREYTCGILTVGKNKWRKIDDQQVAPKILHSNISAYVNGSVCWIHCQDHEIIVFDVGMETFRVITIPDCIPTHIWSLSGKLVNKLIEVNEHLALLVQEGNDQLNVWIYNDDGGNADGHWIKETIKTPPWVELRNLDFKAITGTDVIVIKFIKSKQPQWEYLRYYNKKEKKYYRNRVRSLLDLTSPHVTECRITPFRENLLPVQTIQHGEEIN